MSRLKEMIKDAPVHERRMEVKSYPLDDGRLLVEGWLRDDRLVRGYNWDGQTRPAGVVHWMCVRLLIGGWPITIQDAEAEMPGTPHERCCETRDSVAKVIGVPIVSGYTDEVRRRLGGTAGCAHLSHLIVVMGAAALHGFWTQQSRQPRPAPNSLEEFPGLKYLVNSCALWAEDGPILQRIKEELAKSGSAD